MELYGAYVYTDFCVIRIYFYGTKEGTLIEVKFYFFQGPVLICSNLLKGIRAEIFRNSKIKPVRSLKKYYNQEI